ADGRATAVVNPLGGVSVTSYDGAGEAYCTVSPSQYAQSVTCPAAGAGWLAGTNYTVFDTAGRPTSITNPLGGVTSNTYDGANDLTQTTVSSNDSVNAPNVVTNYVYDGDNRVSSKTVDPSDGSLAQVTSFYYDPNG